MTEALTSRTTPVIGPVLGAIASAGEEVDRSQKLVFRSFLTFFDPAFQVLEGTSEAVLADITERLRLEKERIARLEGREPESVAELRTGVTELLTDLGGALDFILPGALPIEGLLEKLSQLLLKPARVPGEPCLAAPPLLRDLLDVALGKLKGVIGETVATVKDTVAELLFPAFGTAADLAHSVQSVLDDPITAALNLILGQRSKIDCPVEASLGVGTSVIDAVIDRLGGVLAEVLA